MMGQQVQILGRIIEKATGSKLSAEFRKRLFPKTFFSGKKAVGHGGGNIGTTTYMVYLPEYHVSIVVMVNAFPSKSVRVLTKRLIRIVLKEQKAISLIL